MLDMKLEVLPARQSTSPPPAPRAFAGGRCSPLPSLGCCQPSLSSKELPEPSASSFSRPAWKGRRCSDAALQPSATCLGGELGLGGCRSSTPRERSLPTAPGKDSLPLPLPLPSRRQLF